jgi:hypothetical protein
MTEEQRLKEQSVAIRLWDSFSPEQKLTATDVYTDYKYPKSDWSEGSYHDTMRKAADAKRKKYGTTTTYNGY